MAWRISEIGIRMALARAAGLVGAARSADGGGDWAASVPAALASSKLVESFLFGMKRSDPWALAAALATLLAAALVAGYLPARKASWIDPMVALRHD